MAAVDKLQSSPKAAGYIQQLSRARCDNKWAEVPELARKVEKHAPARKSLVTAARAEAAQELRMQGQARGLIQPVDEVVNSVLATLPGNGTREDTFQARACVQWLHWIDGKYDQAILALPPDFLPSGTPDKNAGLTEWTHVCALRASFVRGACHEALGREMEAIATYRDAAAKALGLSSPAKDMAQYKTWTERLLNRYSRIVEPSAASGAATGDDLTSTLDTFRAWARASNGQVPMSGMTTGGMALEDKFSRKTTWLTYYKLLSSLVARISGASPEHLSLKVGDIAIPSRLELCTEVQRVETIYENLLLREVSFPEAHQYNTEVDEWVDQAVINWAAFTGYSWGEADVPAPGKRALSQRMLDRLYRAATRTFQSMTILRHLSTIHASLGQFDLATRSLDSYITIGTKAKARIQKSGEDEPGIDSGDVFIRAVAAGIEMLCAFGDRKEAQRAQELSAAVRQMIHDEELQQTPPTPKTPHGMQGQHDSASHNLIHISVSSGVLAVTYRAIGISNARWAQLTYEAPQRVQYQRSAIAYLRRSLQGSANENNLEALYALAIVRAENRDIQGAIAAVKEALLQNVDDDGSIQTPKHSAQPSTATARCWHLLTLLLSCRQDFDNSAASCDEALDQLGNRISLANSTLELAEKRSIISLRMSRIVLKELLEGPTAAVNDSMTLLALYGEMFKSKPKETSNQPEKVDGHLATSSSTIPSRTMSFRESMFGRSKGERGSQISQSSDVQKSARRHSDSAPHKPQMLSPPDETEEDKRPTTSHSHKALGLSHSGSKRLQKRPSRRSVTKPRQPTTESSTTAANPTNANKSAITSGAPHLAPVSTGNNLQTDVDLAVPENETLDEVTAELPGPHGSLPPTVLSSTILYSDTDFNRRALEALSEIWLFIAGLYRRAKLFGDANGALQEAFKQVRLLEVHVAKEQSSVEAFEQPGWGGSKSVDQLWADTYAERGRLRLAQKKPYDALAEFENALTHFGDHVDATVGLSAILLDIYSGAVAPKGTHPAHVQIADKIDASTSKPVLATVPGAAVAKFHRETAAEDEEDEVPVTARSTLSTESKTGITSKISHTPETLDKLAARDRAFSLLSTLSKLGSGWDQSEVWFTLARAYEESGQMDKAQEALWWVVELEKKRPIRHWSVLGQGYSLWF